MPILNILKFFIYFFLLINNNCNSSTLNYKNQYIFEEMLVSKEVASIEFLKSQSSDVTFPNTKIIRLSNGGKTEFSLLGYQQLEIDIAKNTCPINLRISRPNYSDYNSVLVSPVIEYDLSNYIITNFYALNKYEKKINNFANKFKYFFNFSGEEIALRSNDNNREVIRFKVQTDNNPNSIIIESKQKIDFDLINIVYNTGPINLSIFDKIHPVLNKNIIESKNNDNYIYYLQLNKIFPADSLPVSIVKIKEIILFIKEYKNNIDNLDIIFANAKNMSTPQNQVLNFNVNNDKVDLNLLYNIDLLITSDVPCSLKINSSKLVSIQNLSVIQPLKKTSIEDKSKQSIAQDFPYILFVLFILVAISSQKHIIFYSSLIVYVILSALYIYLNKYPQSYIFIIMSNIALFIYFLWIILFKNKYKFDLFHLTISICFLSGLFYASGHELISEYIMHICAYLFIISLSNLVLIRISHKN
jgi:hypothetical protein